MEFLSQLLVIVLYILCSTQFSISVLVTGAELLHMVTILSRIVSWLVCCLSGWRIGWAIAPPFIASAIRNIHVKITDSAPAPFQEAALTCLRSPPEYFESLRRVGSKEQLIISYLVL